MSLCDRCFDPGRCCKRMDLSTGGNTLTVWTDKELAPQMADHGLPTFEPLEKLGEAKGDDGRPYAWFHWRCTALQTDGRCGIYEARPALCRSFEPLSDPLCVHWNGAETGE